MAKVVLIRHGHTKLNGTSGTSVDRIRGWKDVPLDERGIKDAEKASLELNKKYDIDCIYSSDLSRAFDTAKICNIHDLPITAMLEFRPWNLGIYQGKETKEIIEDLNNMVRHEEVVPKDGEAFKEFRMRFLGALQEIIYEAIDEDEEMAIFTHFRDLKCADAWIKRGCPRDFSIDAKVMMKDDFAPGTMLEIPLDLFDHEEGEDMEDEDEDISREEE
jgi:broad specificity phosphatase PhoE